MRIVYIFVFFFLTQAANALIFDWSYGGTGISGNSATGGNAWGCPDSFASVIFTGDFDSLYLCKEKELRDMYQSGNCCINFIAECNYIERAWWMKTDVIKFTPLCSPMLRKKNTNLIHERRRRFMKRLIKKRRGENSFVMMK